MISCTEFIPAYSELFTYLAQHHGKEEVSKFWDYLFTPDGKGIPLVRFVEEEGIRGCFRYWSGTLNEEAADFALFLNEPAGWFLLEMYHCPSKGRLLELQEKTGFSPYPEYCMHCDYYRSAIEGAGLRYLYNFSGVDRAACSILVYDPKIFQGRVVVDDHTEILRRTAAQNQYFHRDFHSSLNMGMDYLGNRFGVEEVKAFLAQYTRNVLRPIIDNVRRDGLTALEKWIRCTYEKEQAADAVQLERNGEQLQVQVAYCPAVRYLKETGRQVSEWFPYTTEFVMDTLAKETGYHFAMEQYNKESGAASYRFAR